MNDFLSILGSARGAHRGSNEPCSPVLKTLLGPNGPKNHPKAPQGSPRLQKSPGNIDFLRFLCGVLTSFVILFWHAIPWQRSKHHKTKVAIVAPSFQSIRLHISQAEYLEPPDTFESKRDSGSFFQARWRGWPAGQLDIYIYIYVYIYIYNTHTYILHIYVLYIYVYIYIYLYIGVRDLPLRNVLSLGAWRMGLGSLLWDNSSVAVVAAAVLAGDMIAGLMLR